MSLTAALYPKYDYSFLLLKTESLIKTIKKIGQNPNAIEKAQAIVKELLSNSHSSYHEPINDIDSDIERFKIDKDDLDLRTIGLINKIKRTLDFKQTVINFYRNFLIKHDHEKAKTLILTHKLNVVKVTPTPGNQAIKDFEHALTFSPEICDLLITSRGGIERLDRYTLLPNIIRQATENPKWFGVIKKHFTPLTLGSAIPLFDKVKDSKAIDAIFDSGISLSTSDYEFVISKEFSVVSHSFCVNIPSSRTDVIISLLFNRVNPNQIVRSDVGEIKQKANTIIENYLKDFKSKVSHELISSAQVIKDVTGIVTDYMGLDRESYISGNRTLDPDFPIARQAWYDEYAKQNSSEKSASK